MNKERDNQIIERLKSHSAKEVASEFSLTPARISQIAKKYYAVDKSVEKKDRSYTIVSSVNMGAARFKDREDAQALIDDVIEKIVMRGQCTVQECKEIINRHSTNNVKLIFDNGDDEIGWNNPNNFAKFTKIIGNRIVYARTYKLY